MSNLKVGDRAKFVGHDHVFHFGEREGKVGTIVQMVPSAPGDECCYWKLDGDPGVYLTTLEHLRRVEAQGEPQKEGK